MNVIDSSGWLEYFADGPNAAFFAPGIENMDELVVPSISIYEVFKRVLQQRSEDEALHAIVAMQQGKVVDLDVTIALSAAKLSATLQLPMADSIILATGRAFDAIIWTQDADFEGLNGVRYTARGQAGEIG
ncbi:MAG: type II toxin-antitoxin system VapC family toxin [Caldilineales bacterium]|nr:type II toxin-antitoxin system VapC family toxin [Caldilineales bacterium]